MSKKKQRLYRRIDKAERCAIENALDSKKSAREIARELGRSPSSVTDEVFRNRTVSRGPNKGERVETTPKDACSKLLRWPHVCNGCNKRHYHCGHKWRCEYVALRAQRLADTVLSESRKGVDLPEDEFERIVAIIRADLARGLSPSQIAQGRANELNIAPSTMYRWIARGYAGMSNMELRRKVGYKPRIRNTLKPTSHGPKRSFAAFLDLDETLRDCACEMDCVIGKAHDMQCILTLYLRSCKFQVCLLLKQKTAHEVVHTLDMLEGVVGKAAFQQMFGLILTDNGSEFSDFSAIEHSSLPGKATRCKVYYCDVRASQQKAGCERNHVELRKLIPKRRGISFDDLKTQDMAIIMSQLNSEPRASMAFMSPIEALIRAYGSAGQKLIDALGIEHIPYEELLLDIKAINRDRQKRGLDPLI